MVKWIHEMINSWFTRTYPAPRPPAKYLDPSKEEIEKDIQAARIEDEVYKTIQDVQSNSPTASTGDVQEIHQRREEAQVRLRGLEMELQLYQRNGG